MVEFFLISSSNMMEEMTRETPCRIPQELVFAGFILLHGNCRNEGNMRIFATSFCKNGKQKCQVHFLPVRMLILAYERTRIHLRNECDTFTDL